MKNVDCKTRLMQCWRRKTRSGAGPIGATNPGGLRSVGLVSIFAASIAWPTAPAIATPFTNGSFEKGTQDPGDAALTLAAGSTVISGWTVGEGNLDYIKRFWQPANGERSLDLNGSAPGRISQTFDTVRGAKHKVFFCLAGNPDGDPKAKTLKVIASNPANAAEKKEANFSFELGPRSARISMGWKREEFEFTAFADTTKLEFVSTTMASSFGPALDSVAILPVDQVQVVKLQVDVLKGVRVTDNEIEERIKLASAILEKEAQIKLERVKTRRDVSDGGNNDKGVDENEIAGLTKSSLEELSRNKAHYMVVMADVIRLRSGGFPSGVTDHPSKNKETTAAIIPVTFVDVLSGENGGRVLAHEIAHAFTLGAKHMIDCGKDSDRAGHSDDRDNLMFDDFLRATGSTLTPHQKAEIKVKARAGGIAKAFTQGPVLVSLPVRTGTWTDTLGDVSQSVLDLTHGTLFIDFPPSTLQVGIRLNGLHAVGTTVNTLFEVFFNTDNLLTGTTVGSMSGIDKILRVRVTGLFGVTALDAVTAHVVDVASGSTIPLEPGDLAGLQQIVDILAPGTPSGNDIADVFTQTVPLSALAFLADQVPIGILVTDLDTGEFDETFLIYDLALAGRPVLEAVSLEGFTGDLIQAMGRGFAPLSTVTINVDNTQAATPRTSDDGTFSTSFLFPAEALACDVNADGQIDRNDIQAIFASRGKLADHFITAIDEAGGLDFSVFRRTITVNDARICTLRCTKPVCAP